MSEVGDPSVFSEVFRLERVVDVVVVVVVGEEVLSVPPLETLLSPLELREGFA